MLKIREKVNIVFVLTILFGLLLSTDVQAANTYYGWDVYVEDGGGHEYVDGYQIVRDHVGDIRYSKTRDGELSDLITSTGKKTTGYYVIKKGDTLYYTLREKSSKKTEIWSIHLKTKKTKKILSYKSSYGEMMAYNGSAVVLGKLYYRDYSTVPNYKLYSYNIKKKTYKNLKMSCGVRVLQQGNYVYVVEHKANGKVGGLYVYNMKNNKMKKIRNDQDSPYRNQIMGDRLYCAIPASKNAKKYTIKSFKLGGTGVKNLGTITVKDYVHEFYFTEDCMISLQSDEASEGYYKYTYASKKTEEISESEYNKQRDAILNSGICRPVG